MKNSFFFVLALAVIPFWVSAHGAYDIDERFAAFWGNPLMLIGAALLAGAIVGLCVFLFSRNKFSALKAGAIVGGLSAVMLFALANPTESLAPQTALEDSLVGVAATVYKSPSCTCCSGYIEELKRQGADVTVEMVDESRLTAIKAEYGISPEHSSCHTTLIDGYAIEGHVPIEAVLKLRAEKPAIKGITLPGMPSGSPGMPGPKLAPYEVLSLDGSLFMKI